jgi:hypothetical protein
MDSFPGTAPRSANAAASLQPESELPAPGAGDQVAIERRLFRTEALAAKEQPRLGQILLARSISFSFLGAFALTAAIALILLLIFGEYTRKEHVTGQVALDR